MDIIISDRINPNFVSKKHNTNKERFWRFVFKTSDDECWKWLGNKTPRGYGYFKLPTERNIAAHRYSYYLNTGHFPSTEEYICHHCDNPSCVNPKHLFLGTQKDNMQDMEMKGERSSYDGR